MEKRNKSLVYGIAGACFGAASLVSAAGPCFTGNCTACFRCFGMGLALASVAFVKRVRRGVTDEQAHERK